MKSYIKVLSVSALMFAAQSQAATVFNCSGYLKNVFSIGNNAYEVRYSRYSDGGFELEPLIIYPEQTYLLGPVLEAIRQSKNNQVKYTLVVENRDSGDRRCHDGESNNALLAITKY
ncbi:hypothetical protein [Pseudoalteromonas luteoviolacea]|uniref:Uncharacterized protein n=1 Tax=Pseudoalteromonas luteoviolacea H33 TaxID=1365251 RepID=A0A167DZ97_9GAMM|nr:hypothetical protein [Pseudoalteromonas luteoviolacea]KZN49787.1 hypothetical protein N476_18515 [Pseudoalteromonas luteoviolacea H33]KZN77811.1 hypothetical protein N477_00970 [Pseudoalteromonas luteoviolacea H33-S]